eukprot:UN21284
MCNNGICNFLIFESITRTSDAVSFSLSFTYDYVENCFSSNRPYRPSLSHVADRPSLGGVYCI